MSRTLLFGVLNWGLGHASRSIPLVQAFLERGLKVVLASDGEAGALLRDEFPRLQYVELPSYGITYRHESIARNVVPRLPALLWTIRREHAVIQAVAMRENVFALVSDNRYGIYVRGLPHVFVLHQLNLQVNPTWLAPAANRVHRRALKPFSEVWVPDEATPPGLGGALSHPERPLGLPVRYLGVLSRMNYDVRTPRWDVAVVLSGPEPQRTYLEAQILEQLATVEGRHIVVRGKPTASELPSAPGHVEVVSHLTSRALNDVLLSSRAVVCRSGYSSVMDLAALGKPALYIPTPGQTEQEFVARSLAQTGRGIVHAQDEFDLKRGLEALRALPNFPHARTDSSSKVIDGWMKRLSATTPPQE